MRVFTFLREILEFGTIYVVGVVAGLGWMVYGFYIYFQPVTHPRLEADFNHDIGTSLVTQGIIFLITFVVAFVIKVLKGNHEQEEASKDRQMLREMYTWMQEQRKAEAASQPSNLPIGSSHSVK